MNKNQHVVPLGGAWAVKGENNARYTKITQTQQEAIDVAKNIARNQKSELFIHGADGRVRTKYSYGKETVSPKGTPI